MIFLQSVFEAALGVFGLVTLLWHSGAFAGRFHKHTFVYYTNLSNLIVSLYFIARTACRLLGAADGRLRAVFFSGLSHYVVTLMIFVTFLIYHFVLLPDIKKDPSLYGEFADYKRFSNLCVHYITPLATLLDWLLWADKASLDWRSPLYFVLLPLVYAAFVFLRAIWGGPLEGSESRYPYGFIAADVIGWKKTMVNTAGMCAGFIALGYAFYGLARLMLAVGRR